MDPVSSGKDNRVGTTCMSCICCCWVTCIVLWMYVMMWILMRICEYVLVDDVVHILIMVLDSFIWLIHWALLYNWVCEIDMLMLFYMIMQGVMNSYICMLCIAYYYIFLWWCEFSPFCWNDVLCDIAQVLKIVVLRTSRV